MAILALESDAVEEIWLCPSPDRWDKTPVQSLDTREKWASLLAQRLTAAGFPTFVSNEERDLGVYRGTYVFLKHLNQKYPTNTFAPIVGWDAWESLNTWRDPTVGILNGNLLREEFPFLIVPRNLKNNPQQAHLDSLSVSKPHLMLPTFATLQQKHGSLFSIHCNEIANLSSSAIRKALATQQIILFAFPEIEEKIKCSGIYTKSS